MRHSSRRAKARRLQVEVAETLARNFGLTIEATPPTKPGKRKGVIWVREDKDPDLAVRTMGQVGADVALLSQRAKDLVSIYDEYAQAKLPIWFECKNSESWDFGPVFWRKGGHAFIERSMQQATRAAMEFHVNEKDENDEHMHIPVVVLGKNNWPAIAVWRPSPAHFDAHCPPVVFQFDHGLLGACRFVEFIGFMEEPS